MSSSEMSYGNPLHLTTYAMMKWFLPVLFVYSRDVILVCSTALDYLYLLKIGFVAGERSRESCCWLLTLTTFCF